MRGTPRESKGGGWVSRLVDVDDGNTGTSSSSGSSTSPKSNSYQALFVGLLAASRSAWTAGYQMVSTPLKSCRIPTMSRVLRDHSHPRSCGLQPTACSLRTTAYGLQPCSHQPQTHTAGNESARQTKISNVNDRDSGHGWR